MVASLFDKYISYLINGNELTLRDAYLRQNTGPPLL